MHGGAVRNPIIAYDLRFLPVVLNWATVARESGIVLLERNPLKGLPLPVEMSPRRPLVTQEQYQGLRTVSAEVSKARTDLAHETAPAFPCGTRIAGLHYNTVESEII